MNRFLLLVLLALFLNGCAVIWTKPGATQQDFNVDNGDCVAESYRSAPPAVASLPLGGGYQQPTYTNCTGYGSGVNCVTTGGNYVPPARIPIDVNKNARTQIYQGCMYRKGWSVQR